MKLCAVQTHEESWRESFYPSGLDDFQKAPFEEIEEVIGQRVEEIASVVSERCDVRGSSEQGAKTQDKPKTSCRKYGDLV